MFNTAGATCPRLRENQELRALCAGFYNNNNNNNNNKTKSGARRRALDQKLKFRI
jgi:hypothetical protein